MGGRRGPMHHSLTRHRNFSVLSNYLGITANESRSPFAECRRLFLLHRVYFVYTRTYIKIYTSVRTRTRNVSTLRSRRRRHLAVLTNCPPVLFPSRPGIRRIAFQQLLNTPATRGRQVGWKEGGERTIGKPFLASNPFLPLASLSFCRWTRG